MVAPFDASSVDNMKRLVDHSGVVGHIYPLALLCYEVMPPPPEVFTWELWFRFTHYVVFLYHMFSVGRKANWREKKIFLSWNWVIRGS
ncbi:hypothetical protein B296_00049666 [Ensete ventricosum]|uniref:Uncharacterized protein n=1 Tax=Ensete ventricosum TaxID=4639 RepID=A0A426YPQ8_ENSVE|nr:hypothetical protein B296_00049666 [Ensete ventricosum]